MLKDIAENWARRLGAKGASMRQACAIAGINEPTVSMWKRNENTDTDVEFVRRIVFDLGIEGVHKRLIACGTDAKRPTSMQIYIRMEHAVQALTKADV